MSFASRRELKMALQLLSRTSEFLPPNVALTAEILRTLSKFREGYDERVLQGLFEMLCRLMTEGHADKIMSDALALDNEIRFRLPLGLDFGEPGDECASKDEEVLITLVGHAEKAAGVTAAAMADKLGIGNHQTLRERACALARSLRLAGVEIEWGRTPPPTPMEARAARFPIGSCS